MATNDTATRQRGEQDTDNRGRAESGAAAGRSGGQSRAGGSGAAQKRVISKALRVLDEIEHRIHELREELAQQSGESAGTQARGRQDDAEDGDDTRSHGQGRVKHPETDGRLKQNRDGSAGNEDSDNDTQSNGQGGRSNRGQGNQGDVGLPGQPGNRAGAANRGRTQQPDSDDENESDDTDTQPGGQGRVKNPATDGRTNRGGRSNGQNRD